jgi:hypothetical protein
VRSVVIVDAIRTPLGRQARRRELRHASGRSPHRHRSRAGVADGSRLPRDRLMSSVGRPGAARVHQTGERRGLDQPDIRRRPRGSGIAITAALAGPSAPRSFASSSIGIAHLICHCFVNIRNWRGRSTCRGRRCMRAGGDGDAGSRVAQGSSRSLRAVATASNRVVDASLRIAEFM